MTGSLGIRGLYDERCTAIQRFYRISSFSGGEMLTEAVTLKDIHDYLVHRLPIEQIPLNWDSTGYTSDAFNRWAGDPTFAGWAGDLPTEEEVRVIVELLQTRSGDTLLDVACGYGRHALLLTTKHGLKVTGIDVSSGLIATARRLAAEQGVEIIYEVRHATDLPWSSVFDRAICVYNSFSLFAPEAAPVVLQRIHRALRPGGRLFLDLDNTAFTCRYGTSETHWYTWSGGLTLQEIYLHQDRSVEVCRDLVVKTDTTQVEEFVIFKRMYSRREMCDLLSACGFRVVHISGGWDLSPLEEHSPKMLFVGMKA
jgi:cyclopropane fatty-acyl-phospholipid synthase-like methyltransferase